MAKRSLGVMSGAVGCLCVAIGCVPGAAKHAAVDAGMVTNPSPGATTAMEPRPNGGVSVPGAPKPLVDLGPVVQATTPPPPISGGTLLVLADGRFAVASDPDRDRIYVISLAKRAVNWTITLAAGDEPGRLTEDSGRRVHVALRRGAAVVTFDPATGKVIGRRKVCSAPRGIAYDGAGDLVHVACAGGELVSLAAADQGGPVRTVQLEPDLRDVVVENGRLFVSKFRSAEVLVLSADGSIVDRLAPRPQIRPIVPVRGAPTLQPLTATMPSPSTPVPVPADGGVPSAAAGQPVSPAVAWRMIATPDGVALAHQRGVDGEIGTQPGGYGGTCSGIVESVVTTMSSDRPPISTAAIANAVLPVDLAISRDGTRLALVAAGNARVPLPQVMVWRSGNVPSDGCVSLAGGPSFDAGMRPPSGPPDASSPDDEVPEPTTFQQPPGEAIAVAFDVKGNVIVQTREPAALFFVTQPSTTWKVALATETRADTGHAIFHSNSGAGVACASCHPEGGEDARIWRFAQLGPRRTQSLRGGVLARAPFHWDGALADLSHLMQEVFVGRMSGPVLGQGYLDGLGHWLDAIPELPVRAGADSAAVTRGRTLFESPSVGCATCHAGDRLTNNTKVDVGTGGVFKVPSLRGLIWRAPYLHDGCARTLAGRFDACGGGDRHGMTSSLRPGDLADLQAYLGTL